MSTGCFRTARTAVNCRATVISGAGGTASSMTDSLDGKTFILGIGAQKAGTTWLHEYLQARPEVFLSPLKELHYFDAKHLPESCARFHRVFEEQEARLERRWRWPGSRRVELLRHVKDRVRMIRDDAAYVEYFERHVPAACSLFGEITPSYAQLPSSGFEDIARRFERIKVIFLLRDPVDRFFSHFRMRMRRHGRDRVVEDAFIAAMDDADFVEKSFYQETYATLRSVFADADIHIGFFEELFCDAEVGRLCAFLDLDFIPGAYDMKANAAPDDMTLDPDLRARARDRFDDVYRFLSRRVRRARSR